MPEVIDEKYQSEWDAQSLAEAEKIKNDPKRYEKAQQAAVRLAEEEREKAKAMTKVASGVIRANERKNLGIRMPTKEDTEVLRKTGFNVFKKI